MKPPRNRSRRSRPAPGRRRGGHSGQRRGAPQTPRGLRAGSACSRRTRPHAMRALPALPDERGFEFFLTYLLSAFPEMFGHAPVIFAGRVWGAFQSPTRRASSVSSTRPPPPPPVNIRSRRRTFSTLTVTSHCANSRRHRSDGTWGSHRSPRGFRGHGGPGWGEEVPREPRLPRAPPVLAAKSSAGLSRKQMMMQNPVKRRSLQRRRHAGAGRGSTPPPRPACPPREPSEG